MSSIKRSTQRRYVKNKLLKEQGNTHGFKEAWEEYRRKEIKNSDGTTTVVHQQKRRKKIHYDNSRVLLNHMRAFKAMVAGMMKKNKEKTNN